MRSRYAWLSLLQRHWPKLAIAALLFSAAGLGLNLWIVRSTDRMVYTSVGELPLNDVGLVLGTRRLLPGGTVNRHFQARIDAAAELYRTGKVRHLLLSGDNHVRNYDEPTDMQQALVAEGVPATAMTLDYAGFRTLDSVVRARKVFGQRRLTVITDDFHAHRAVFLARHTGLDAVAYCSQRVPLKSSVRSRIRELAARVKAVLDIFVLRTEPHFLGERIAIRIDTRI